MVAYCNSINPLPAATSYIQQLSISEQQYIKTGQSSSSCREDTYTSWCETESIPQCIIIRVRRCATRALLDYLDLHPDVEIVPRERHFFNIDRNYHTGLQWYLRQIPLTYSKQYTIENTPKY